MPVSQDATISRPWNWGSQIEFRIINLIIFTCDFSACKNVLCEKVLKLSFQQVKIDNKMAYG